MPSISGALFTVPDGGGEDGQTRRSLPATAADSRFDRLPDKHATFDDGTMAATLYFLFDLSDLIVERDLRTPYWLEEVIDNGLSFIVKNTVGERKLVAEIRGQRISYPRHP